MNKYFATSEKVSVTNYPYGFKQTTAFFSLEFKKGKGFRSVFQTIDPKSGRLNKPKNSTYSPVLVIQKDENGHVSYVSYDFNGAEEFNEGCKFMSENFDLFTQEQIKSIYWHCFLMLRATTKAMVIYSGSKFEDVKPLMEVATTKAIECSTKGGENLFSEMLLDVEALENTTQKDYNPFRTVEYAI